MDQLITPTKDDLKLLQKREYRQQCEQARKERIFNPRVRLIGIDKNALDQHMQEKQIQKLSKQKEEMCYAAEQNRYAEAINTKLNEIAEDRLQNERRMNEFREQFQKKEQRREFDLNDPHRLRKISPSDGLEWLGVDDDHMHRVKLQREQQKSWLQQQIDEKNELKKNLNETQVALANNTLFQQDQLIKQQQFSEQEQRRKLLDNVKFNLMLTEMRKAKQKEDKRREEEDNLAEIMNHLSSDMLMEIKEQAASSLFGENRINPAAYRGMTEEQLKEIRCEQLRQIEEKRCEFDEMKKSDLQFGEAMKNHINTLEVDEQAAMQKRQQLQAQQRSINALLLEEQKQRNQHLNNDVYKFTPTEAYFDQFNRSSR